MVTYAEQLDSVQAAIATIESGGQAVGFDGRTLSRADLATLYKREKWLRTRVARQARGGARVMRVVPL